MNRILLRLTIRRHWLPVLLCTLVPVIIGGVMGLIYPAYGAQRELLESGIGRLLNNFTEFFGQGQMDLLSPEGSFSFPMQHPFCLVVSAFVAAIAPVSLPAGERRTGLDLLLATPLTRRQLVLTVAVFSVGVATLYGLAGFVGALFGASLAGESEAINRGSFAVAAVNSGALCLFFGGLALVVSVYARDRGQAAVIYGIIVVVALVLDITARMWPDGAFLRYWTPYGYLRPAEIVSANGDATAGLATILVLAFGAAALTVLALLLQDRRRSA